MGEGGVDVDGGGMIVFGFFEYGLYLKDLELELELEIEIGLESGRPLSELNLASDWDRDWDWEWALGSDLNLET